MFVYICIHGTSNARRNSHPKLFLKELNAELHSTTCYFDAGSIPGE